MSVSVTVPGVGQYLKSIGARTISLDGSEQAICEQLGGRPSQISGYIDLSNLGPGDIVVVRYYVKVKESSAWGMCYEESYSDSLNPPIVYVAKRPENHGSKFTIQQTVGSLKIIDYEFYEES